MSTITTSTPSLTGASYATQLAQASSIRRTLFNLGTAIQSGDLAPANSILSAFFKANPEYLTNPVEDSQSTDSLSQNFQTLATAISNNQVGAAQTAWAMVKTDLANNGVSLEDEASSTSQAEAQAREGLDSEVLTGMFGVGGSSGAETGLAALLVGSSGSGSQTGLSSSLIGSWLTYQQTGTPSLSIVPSSGNILDAAA